MDDVYAVKKTSFLGKPVLVICQNINGPCPLLAICNVLLLRGHLAIESFVSQDGLISAHDLMRVVQSRLVSTNPLVRARVNSSCAYAYVVCIHASLVRVLAGAWELGTRALDTREDAPRRDRTAAESPRWTRRERALPQVRVYSASCSSAAISVLTALSVSQCAVCRITDFEYTVECAVFDMLDIALVHGWLLDAQDASTVRTLSAT